MALKIPKLENLPMTVQMSVLAALVVLMVVAAYLTLFKDMLQNKSVIEAEIAKLEVSIAQGRAIESQLARFEAELKRLDQRLQMLRAILPDQKETPTVLRSVQQMAAESNLKIVKFQPQPVVPRTFYSDWPIQIEVQGYYDALGLFFEKISQATRIINVANITIKGIDGSTDPAKTLQAVCTATTFVFREETAAPLAAGR